MIGYRKRRQELVKKVAIGSTLAAVVGYVAGLLTAPQSGKETRKDIKAAAEKGRKQAEKELTVLHKNLEARLQEAKKQAEKAKGKASEELNELIEKARISKDKTREVISAIHDGDAQDQDLKRAIKNARAALDHLSDYLKK